MKTTAVLLAGAASLPGALAWGVLGHESVAYLAQNFVKPSTAAFCQNALADTTTSYLANVATWADSYRYTSAGHWSSPLHFIDAMDSPPSSCGVDFNRDCGPKGCVVSAIQNYTSRMSDTTQSAANIDEAVKFLVHFIGDIHQPLHDENLDIGGNTIKVTYGSLQTNLHAVWDTSMPQAIAGAASLTNAQAYAQNLTDRIKTGDFASQAAGWLQSINVADPVTSASFWANEANAFVCSVVIPQGPTAVDGQDLSGAYFQSAASTVELQLARAGYRLAAWLDAIVDGINGGGSPPPPPPPSPSSSTESNPPATTSIDGCVVSSTTDAPAVSSTTDSLAFPSTTDALTFPTTSSKRHRSSHKSTTKRHKKTTAAAAVAEATPA